MTPRARGRASCSKRCDAAAVATGIRMPPPIAWTTRAAMSQSSDCADPASADPMPNVARPARNGRRTPQRSDSRPASGIVTTDARR
jgi:hypothetical protein